MILKPKRFFCLSFTLLVFSFFTYLVMGIISFPSEIYLVAGSEKVFNFGGPFSGKSVTVSNALDSKVQNNIVIDENSTDMTVALFGIPVKNVSVDILPDTEVVPCGITVGIQIDTTGVMALGTGSVSAADGTSQRPCEGKIKSGDILLKANGIDIENQTQFTNIIENLPPGQEISLTVKRNDQTFVVSISPVINNEDGKNKIGLWVRDSTKGIGTVTYYNRDTSKFGALGHGIVDVDTKQLIPIKNGQIFKTDIVTVKKGKKGNPGELVGDVDKSLSLGTISQNSPVGLYGSINYNQLGISNEAVKIALQSEIHEGPAQIISNVNGHEIKKYDVYIERVNKYSSDESKGMIIRITDPELITKTNGIVQGMSGCPVLQNGKIVGAVTHVFVQNPLKGYGIFIENMIKQEKSVS